MGIKIILAAVTSLATGEDILRTAMGLARRFDGHVDVLHVRADPRASMPYMGEGMSGAAIQEILDVTQKDEADLSKELRGLFDRFCQDQEIAIAEAPPAGFSALWVEETGHEDDAISRRGRLADLIIVARESEGEGALAAMTIEAALFDSGRPILIVPEGNFEKTGSNVAIAWNGSVEAARAVSAALPILKKAEKVTVLWGGENVSSDQAQIHSKDLARYLAWRDIHADSQVIYPRSGHTGGALLEAAAEQGADLLVMGAYTHNRLRQIIFGGVTRHVMSGSKIPILMAH